MVTLKGLYLLIYMRGLRTELVNAFSSYSKRESEGVCECECVGVCSCVGVCVCVWGWELKKGKKKKKKKKKRGGGRGESFPFSATIYSPNAPFWDTGSCWASGVFVPHRDSPIP